MSHLDFATLVDYWTRDMSPAEAEDVEAHLFECDACTVEASRVAKVTAAIRAQLPPAITTAELAQLRTRGLAIEENVFVPGKRATVTFGDKVDLMIHHLSGLDLAAAERVALTVRSERGGVLHHDPFVPFDAATGEVLIACQRHFSQLPHDVVFDVFIHRPAAPVAIATYELPHVFAFSPPAPSA